MSHTRRLMILVAAAWLSISSSSAAELIMVRQPGCSWCAAWDRDIAPIYDKTEVGQRAPLRMVDLRNRHSIALKTPIIYTPTFVLVEKGREIGRIEGYSGDHFFWDLLERLLQQLPADASGALSIALQKLSEARLIHEPVRPGQDTRSRYRHDDRERSGG